MLDTMQELTGLPAKPCHLRVFCIISWWIRCLSSRIMGLGFGLRYHFGTDQHSGWWCGPIIPKFNGKLYIICGSISGQLIWQRRIKAKSIWEACWSCRKVVWNLSRQCNVVKPKSWTNCMRIYLSFWTAWWYLGSMVCTWCGMWFKGVLKSPHTTRWCHCGNCARQFCRCVHILLRLVRICRIPCWVDQACW